MVILICGAHAPRCRLRRIAQTEMERRITICCRPDTAREARAIRKPMLIETHAHLDYPDFAGDFDDVLRRATDAGVTRIITIGTSVESSRRAVELAEKYPNIFRRHRRSSHLRRGSGRGCDHAFARTGEKSARRGDRRNRSGLSSPAERGWSQRNARAQVFARRCRLRRKRKSKPDIHDGAYKSKQASLFEQQLDLAVELGLNVVIHQRDAWDDTLEIMRPYGRKSARRLSLFRRHARAGK